MTLLLLCASAAGEGLGFDQLDRAARGTGFDALAFLRKLLTGEALSDMISLDQVAGAVKDSVLQGISGLALSLVLPVAACVVLRLVVGSDRTMFMMDLLCALCCGTALVRVWTDAQQQVSVLIDSLLRATENLTPVMASAAALTGGAAWSAAAVPLSNLCASLIQRALRDWGLGACGCAAVVALCGAVAGEYSLNRLFDLLKSLARWLMGAVVFLYGGLLSAQGMLSAAKDGAAVQTAKVAIETVVPIIGGGVSDAAGALAVSAGLLRGAVGVTGVVLILHLCAPPVLALGGQTAALKLLSAALEPLAEGSAARLIGHFGDILEITLAIAICSAILAAMLPAGCAALVGGLLQ